MTAETPAPPDPAPDMTKDALTVLLVTGISGAGKSTALNALEDLGYEAVDNLPLGLVPQLALPAREAGAPVDDLVFQKPLAIGIDIRTRDFGSEEFSRITERLVLDERINCRVLFLECDDAELSRRFAETRRRHPLATDRPISDGIALERRLMAPIREQADLVLDTSDLPGRDLKAILSARFGDGPGERLSLFVVSFGFRNGLPREADLVFDVRFLKNPHYDPDLRPKTGRDAEVAAFIDRDPDFAGFLERLQGLIGPLLPRYRAEGKSYLTLAIGCTGGKHRSVYTAERLVQWLQEQGVSVHLRHRDLHGASKP
ncbi:MAG: RNase adapter RapZ [Magnetovibrionaceae bacterium]